MPWPLSIGAVTATIGIGLCLSLMTPAVMCSIRRVAARVDNGATLAVCDSCGIMSSGGGSSVNSSLKCIVRRDSGCFVQPNPQMQSDRPISARLRVGGTITGCDKEALICVGAGFIGPAAADLHSVGRTHETPMTAAIVAAFFLVEEQ